MREEKEEFPVLRMLHPDSWTTVLMAASQLPPPRDPSDAWKDPRVKANLLLVLNVTVKNLRMNYISPGSSGLGCLC